MATLLSGFLMAQVSGTLADRIRLPLLLAAVCGFGASLTMLTIQEKKQKTDPSAGRNWFDWRALKENRNFRTLVLFNLTHSFFMSMAWPLFPMTIVRIVKSDMLQVAYMSIISGSVSLFMRRYVGRLTDRAGRKPLIVLGRVGVAVYSLVYAFATEVYHIYIADFVSGIIAVSAEIAIFAYILDITTEEQRGASVAVHNTLMGISTFFGSILGGYLVVFFGQIGLNPDDALKASYIVSSLGRFLGGLLFLRVSEQYPYPSTVRKELVGLISEDMERTRYNIMRIEDMGEKADIDLMRDMEHLEPPSRQKKETEE